MSSVNVKLESGDFLRIERLFAFISKNKQGNEGVMGMQTPDGEMIPLIGADMDRIESLRFVADKIAKEFNTSYELREFNDFDFTKLAELIGEWYVEWKDKITDDKVSHRFGFAKEDLKQKIEEKFQ